MTLNRPAAIGDIVEFSFPSWGDDYTELGYILEIDRVKGRILVNTSDGDVFYVSMRNVRDYA